MIVQRKRFSFNKVELHKCDKYVKKPHFCFMTPIEVSNVEDPSSTLFEITHHLLPYYCVVEKVCFKCESKG